MSDKKKMCFLAAYELAHELKKKLEDVCDRIEIAGSIRRKCETVGDIEFVARAKFESADFDLFGLPTHKSLLWPRLDSMEALGEIRYNKAGNVSRQFIWRDVQVDFYTAPVETYGWILLLRTGSSDFNQRILRRLKRNDYTSDGGTIIDNDGRAISTPSEEDVFRLAKHPFIEPEARVQ